MLSRSTDDHQLAQKLLAHADAGARAVAVISDLLATGDPTARVREYLSAVST
jgi:hypothetical protein